MFSEECQGSGQGWREAQPLPLPLANLGGASLGGMFHLVGGGDGTGARRAEIYSWDGANEAWAASPPRAPPPGWPRCPSRRSPSSAQSQSNISVKNICLFRRTIFTAKICFIELLDAKASKHQNKHLYKSLSFFIVDFLILMILFD